MGLRGIPGESPPLRQCLLMQPVPAVLFSGKSSLQIEPTLCHGWAEMQGMFFRLLCFYHCCKPLHKSEKQRGSSGEYVACSWLHLSYIMGMGPIPVSCWKPSGRDTVRGKEAGRFPSQNFFHILLLKGAGRAFPLSPLNTSRVTGSSAPKLCRSFEICLHLRGSS